MSEFIDRNKLLKTINENVAEAHNERCSQLLEAILNAPIANVVEVVRCKDCVHWDREHIEMHTRSTEDSTLAEFAECERWSDWATCRMLRYDDYCSCSERRTDNGT